MIDVSNLKDALETLGFVAHGDIHEKVFPEIGCSLKVDFHAKKLIYPNEIKGRERNNGFDKKENFVVFECVCRLLSKGYRPEHIELEKEWHLGHDPKGGRADICVTDTSGNMLFIIECKTWGREYDKALNNTKSDGAQLFSYWQQEQSCKWLVLYASDLKGGCIVHKASTIDCSDDANIVLLSKKDKSINKSLSVADLEGSEYFKMYVMAFADSSDAKNLLKTKAYQQKSADEQAAAYLERLYSYASSIEREKLFYFSLVYQQTTVIITAPADNKAQKEFLGYDWSNRKGNEGIQIITPGGKMYDDADRAAEGTLANAIKKSFQGDAPSFREEVREYGAMVSTKNMLDFSRIDFNKAIRSEIIRKALAE